VTTDTPVPTLTQPARAPGRRSGPRWPTALVLACYLALALCLTWSWWTPLGGRVTAVNSPDMVLFSWLLSSTPHALLHGQFPLFTALLNAPDGINLMWNNGMALPAVLFAPVTWLWGGLATVTVITTVGLAGSAATAYWCLRSRSVRVLPAAVGGLLFGFSPAMLAQSLGHPNLVFNVLVPVLVLLAVRIMIDERPAPKLAVLLGITAGAQVLIGEEVLFDTGLVIALFLIVLAISFPRAAARRARLVAGRAALALGVFVLVAGVPLGFQLLGPLQQTGSPFNTAYYSADLAGYVVPTTLQVFASDAALERSGGFAGGLEEHTAYLGWSLIVLCGLVLVGRWRNPAVRTTLLVALLVAVLALGEELTVDGEKQGIALPWKLITELPGFEHVIATRFALFTAGLIGAALAFALDDLFDHPPAVRVAGFVVTALALLPLVPAPLPGKEAPEVPEFFAAGAAALPACPGGSTLVLPYPKAESTDAMAWQEAAGLSFAMPGGYFIGPGTDGHAYVGGQPSATGELFDDVMRDGTARPVTPEMRAGFSADLKRWRACSVVLGPARNLDALQWQATELIGTQPELVDGVLLWRDLSGVPAG
jgi:hypothetical protein